MKKECSIIRDMLPLYFENMVSEDTAEEKEKKNLWYAVICYARRFGHCSNAILEWHRI